MKNNYKSIIFLLFSIITCGLAQGLTILAIPWHFASNLNASSMFALGYAIITFISVFWGLYAGAIIDGFNRKKILIYINVISAFIFLIAGLFDLFYNVYNHFVMLIVFACCSFYYTIFFPNLYALAQELSNQKKYVKINSFIEIFFQITSISAAIICGFLLSGSNAIFNYFNFQIIEFKKWDMGELFLLNSVLYSMTFLILLFVNNNHQINKRFPKFSSLYQDIKKALLFFKKNPHILIYGICSQIIFAFLIVELFTLLPLFVKNCLQENIIVFSLADVTYGLGAIIAGLITAKMLKYIDKISLTIFLIIISAYTFLTMITFLKLNIFFITSIIIGITNASIRITRMTYFFENIPNNIIGRTNTIFNTINTIIRGILILMFSLPWFEQNNNVVFGYKIGIIVLIIFSVPLIIQKKLY